ncbi:hypothetical protein KR009_007999 [Drosophila setifemur]|nr:hypothetical protein KR009_007999 [Drosophila setifemur]
MTAAAQEFCVRWNSHLGSIGAAFPQLLAVQRFVDVTLACEGHQLHCHRLVLAACSTYFEAILAENPCKHPVIILPREIKLWEIQALVDFMYKGEVNVTQAGLGQLLRCAEQLRIRGLYGSEAPINYKQLHDMKSETAKNAEPLPESLERAASSDADDGATNSTTLTTATTIPEMSAKQQQNPLIQQNRQQQQQQQPQQQQPQKDVRQRQQVNGSNLQQSALNAASVGNNPNIPTEDDSADEASNNWNVYGDNFGNCRTPTPAGGNRTTAQQLQQQPRLVRFFFQQQHLDSTIEDDHNYVVAHDEDSRFTAGGVPSAAGLSISMDSELDTSINTPAGLMHNSIDGYTSYKRVRRSEASLAQAAKCVSKGETFQTVSNMFNIPVSTIRFYMARKGILPKRKRGRGASHAGNMIIPLNSGSLSGASASSLTHHHHQSHHVPLDTVDLKAGNINASGSNSPATVTATSVSPSMDIGTTEASVPFHLLSDAASFKLNEQQLHMI